MIMNIYQAGEHILRQPAKELTVKEIRSKFIQQLIESMKETMYAAPGVGLAAPQIGESLQLAVIEDRTELQKTIPANQLLERERCPTPFQVIINPKIIVEQPEKIAFFEGCLSMKGILGLVPRYRFIKVQCLNEKAEPVIIEARGWHARILQHETEHLQGILCVDHAKPRSLMTVDNYLKYWSDKPVSCICEALHINC